MCSYLLSAFMLCMLSHGLRAQVVGSASDIETHFVKREATTPDENPESSTKETAATAKTETPAEKSDPPVTPAPPAEAGAASSASVGTASGASVGTATGSGSAFPFFQPLPSFAPFAPMPYYGFPMYQPYPFFDFNSFNSQLQNWIQNSEQQAQQAAARIPPFPYFGAAQGLYGPAGGYAQTFVYPPPKAGQSVTYQSFKPPPSGLNQFGVSSFSSSSFSDTNGNKKGNQFSQVSVNDNGNITTVVSSNDPKNAPLQLPPVFPVPIYDNNIPLVNNFYRG